MGGRVFEISAIDVLKHPQGLSDGRWGAFQNVTPGQADDISNVTPAVPPITSISVPVWRFEKPPPPPRLTV